MKPSHWAIVVWLSMFAVVSPITVAEAGPFRDFFQAIRSAVAPAREKPRAHRRIHKHNETPPSDVSDSKHNETPPSDASDNQTSSRPVPAPLDRRDVRVAKAAAGATQQKTELPYGTPVPGKPGLVTSPFAPDRGYVDVTGFAPGTEVQDPFTGKTFITP
ncbi:MAG TPA: hypothetical protein VH254_03440 [Candidatus Udaeobacter sp.]|nr:hypothetical protein [Candidatus Udaeobacter sp.]